MERLDIEESLATAKDVAVDSIRQGVESIKENAKDQLYLDNNRKGVLDAVQEKMVSRKLLVFITATVLMWYGLDPETWGMIAMMYIGGQSAIDMVKTWKHGA
ncbi:MAG: hypothetical protein CBC29_07110 [Methylococcaceae bacterium TMED69]|nr:MAG: hypothetical protein CBC29_07110 [Methylococcaceae bacterium TMED69]|tara:strand:+ start:622 stop:927 length:306 start_codon:yes stop_codon:yes gene_type:complete